MLTASRTCDRLKRSVATTSCSGLNVRPRICGSSLAAVGRPRSAGSTDVTVRVDLIAPTDAIHASTATTMTPTLTIAPDATMTATSDSIERIGGSGWKTPRNHERTDSKMPARNLRTGRKMPASSGRSVWKMLENAASKTMFQASVRATVTLATVTLAINGQTSIVVKPVAAKVGVNSADALRLTCVPIATNSAGRMGEKVSPTGGKALLKTRPVKAPVNSGRPIAFRHHPGSAPDAATGKAPQVIAGRALDEVLGTIPAKDAVPVAADLPDKAEDQGIPRALEETQVPVGPTPIIPAGEVSTREIVALQAAAPVVEAARVQTPVAPVPPNPARLHQVTRAARPHRVRQRGRTAARSLRQREAMPMADLPVAIREPATVAMGATTNSRFSVLADTRRTTLVILSGSRAFLIIV